MYSRLLWRHNTMSYTAVGAALSVSLANSSFRKQEFYTPSKSNIIQTVELYLGQKAPRKGRMLLS